MIINTNNIMIVKIKHEKINYTPPQLSSSSSSLRIQNDEMKILIIKDHEIYKFINNCKQDQSKPLISLFVNNKIFSIAKYLDMAPHSIQSVIHVTRDASLAFSHPPRDSLLHLPAETSSSYNSTPSPPAPLKLSYNHNHNLYSSSSICSNTTKQPCQ